MNRYKRTLCDTMIPILWLYPSPKESSRLSRNSTSEILKNFYSALIYKTSLYIKVSLRSISLLPYPSDNNLPNISEKLFHSKWNLCFFGASLVQNLLGDERHLAFSEICYAFASILLEMSFKSFSQLKKQFHYLLLYFIEKFVLSTLVFRLLANGLHIFSLSLCVFYLLGHFLCNTESY